MNCANGLVSLEREAYEQMDVGLQGKSEVIPLTLNKDGSVSKRGTSGAAPVDFTALTAFVNRKICGAAEQILKGDIDIRPYQMESKTGCDHCRITVCVVLIQKWKDIRFGKIKNYLRMKCGRISTGKEAIPMSVKWTEEQEKVIQLRNRSLLVSAAAGSGKTAVLVQRIISMVMDEVHPLDIDRLLVVTFTNAAAAEMRERVGICH